MITALSDFQNLLAALSRDAIDQAMLLRDAAQPPACQLEF
jgi:hypothetical protein